MPTRLRELEAKGAMRTTISGLICFFSWLPVVVDAQGTSPFLNFPLKCGDKACTFKYTKGAYTPASVNSVLDHQMEMPYLPYDGVVTAFTGESGVSRVAKAEIKGPAPCYPPTVQTGSKFSVAGLYKGTSDDCLPHQGLNYDNHPGYDYVADIGMEVYAAAKGKVVTAVNKVTRNPERCIPKGIDKQGCEVWGYIGVDHGNGYVTQYGHLSRIYFKSGDLVNAGDLIGLSGQKSPPAKDKNGYITAPYSVSPHLHFEVLKESQAAPYGYAFVDPYGWEGKTGEDPLEQVTDKRNVRLWRLDTAEVAADPAKQPFTCNQLALSPDQKIAFLGSFSNVRFTEEHQYGISVELWRAGDTLIGYLANVAGLIGSVPRGVIVNVNYLPTSGSLTFQAELSMGEHSCDIHKFVRSRDIFQFDGRLTDTELVGAIKTLDGLHVDRIAQKENVVLRRDGSNELYTSTIKTYAEWNRRVQDWHVYSRCPP